MKRILGVLGLLGLLAAATPASATVVVGGYSFADNAFADTLVSSSGEFTTSGGSLASVLTDINAGTFAFSFSPDAFVELRFTDNTLGNGSGPDLVLFELGEVLDSLNVTINSITRAYLAASTGGTVGDGVKLNAVSIDLDDFGLAADAQVETVKVGFDILGQSVTRATLSLVGALNSGSAAVVPEPTSLALVGLALAGVAASRRRLT